MTATTLPPKSSSPAAAKAAVRRYPYDEALFRTALHEATMESVLSPVEFREKHEVKLKPAFNTACWAYQPPHLIYIGQEIFEKETVRKGLTELQQKRYVANHYHHELGHALFTERDMGRIQKQLKLIGAPFSLYNLFEDAYMENRYRREAEYQFNWLDLEDASMTARPEAVYFGLIQSEGNIELVRGVLDEWVEPPQAIGAKAKLQKDFDLIVDFYARSCKVRRSMALMPLITEWLERFPESKKEDATSAAKGMQDLSLSANLMLNAAFAATFDVGTKSIEGGSATMAEGAQGLKAEKAEGPPQLLEPVAKKGTLLGANRTNIDLVRVLAVAAKFEKLFIAKVRHSQTTTPQKRLSARHYALGRPYYRRKDVECKGTQTIYLEVDCSGSMSGHHIQEGQILVAALSLLAQKGLVRGHVVLSGVKQAVACYETYQFPMAIETIERIVANCGAEGLEYTLKENLKLAREADHVFVYTDGQIVDKPVDKAYLHSRGVFTWGLYAGDNPEFLGELTKYFDKAIMRTTAEELVDAILTQLK